MPTWDCEERQFFRKEVLQLLPSAGKYVQYREQFTDITEPGDLEGVRNTNIILTWSLGREKKVFQIVELWSKA